MSHLDRGRDCFLDYELCMSRRPSWSRVSEDTPTVNAISLAVADNIAYAITVAKIVTNRIHAPPASCSTS